MEHGLATYTIYGTLNELENELEEYPAFKDSSEFFFGKLEIYKMRDRL